MTLLKKSQNVDGFRISKDELEHLLKEDSLQQDVGDLRMEVDEDFDEFDYTLPTVIVTEEVHSLPKEDEDDEEIVIDEDKENNEKDKGEEFSLKLDKIPGAESQDDIVIPEEEISEDPWSWKHDNAFEWCQNRIDNIPKHSGYDVAGLERVISYLERFLSEVSKMARTDHDSILDIKRLEEVRNEIIEGIRRCEDRLEKVLSLKKGNKNRKKKADEEYEFIKEAQKTARFTVTVPLLISFIVRTCINSTVSAGHDLNETFKKMAKEYNLDKREKAEAIQLLSDMGYAVYLDRGLIEQDVDITSSNNFDWVANYPG